MDLLGISFVSVLSQFIECRKGFLAKSIALTLYCLPLESEVKRQHKVLHLQQVGIFTRSPMIE